MGGAMARPRILIADDEEGIRESLNLILGDTYDLIFAHDGEQALDRLQRSQVSLAILDIKMPKMDGLQVLKRVREEGVSTPVLMLTAYQSVELAREAVNCGALDYLPKPFEREQILKAVRGILAQV